MVMVEGVDEMSSAPVTDDDPNAATRPKGRLPRWVKVVLLVAVTLIAVIAFVLWLPGADASPTGGCGGG